MLAWFLGLPTGVQVCIVVVLFELAFLAWLVWEVKRSPLYADDEMRERIYTDEEKAREEKKRAKRARAQAQTSVQGAQAVRGDTPR